MEFNRTPRQSGRRTFPSRPRSRLYPRKKNLVKRVASTLRRRRSQLHCLYQNALIEMAESKLNLPHEGQPGLIYAVSEIPSGHSRQSLVDVFDDVVANMSAVTTKSSIQRSWETYHISHDTSSQHSADLLTGDYDNPEDFDRYLVWQPLKPVPLQPSSNTNAQEQDLAELNWPAPRTPSKASNESLIDLDTPPSTCLPTPQDVYPSKIDELYFGDLSGSLTSPPLLPSQSLASLDPTLFPQPLNFKDSPFPVLWSPRLTASHPITPPKTLHKRATHGNLRLDTQHPALRVALPSTTSTPSKNQIAQHGHLISRKPVPETPVTRNTSQQWLTPSTPTPTHYHPYRPPMPIPTLPPVLTRPTDSLLDEMKDEIDRVLASFALPAAAAAAQPSPSPHATDPSTFQLPPTHRVPTRTTSRTAPSTPSNPTPAHSPRSFRSRLGASTLQALLGAADAALPIAPLEPYGWHRWVDRARDQDSETEEQEHSRRWRMRRREERRRLRMKGGEGGGWGYAEGVGTEQILDGVYRVK